MRHISWPYAESKLGVPGTALAFVDIYRGPRPAGRMCHAGRYPPEFKGDVVAAARTSGLTHAQIAYDPALHGGAQAHLDAAA